MLNSFNTQCKRLLLFLFFSTCFIFTDAQLARLSQRPPSNGNTGWVTNNYSVCGTGNRDWLIQYNYCGSNPNGPCTIGGSCGANPYRIHFRLFRNGNQIANTTYQTSQAWGNWPIYNYATQPGVYHAEIRLEMKKNRPFWPFCSGWEHVQTKTTNSITVTRIQAQPNFNINGIAIPSNGSPIYVCGSNIRVNAAATSCETRYMVSIQECDRWWNRTGQYEVDVWFNGEAPNNINLQQLAVNYSQPPTFIGPVNRYNTTLFGGNLPNGQKRYYRVSICVNEPLWVCKTALIEVDGNCRADAGEEDTNNYDIIASGNNGTDKADLEFDTILEGNGDGTNTDMDMEPCTDKVIPGADPVNADEESGKNKISVQGRVRNNLGGGANIKLSPNPAKGQVALAFELKQEALVLVNIFDAAGNRLKQGLVNKKLPAGQQTQTLDISSLKAGIYIVEVIQGKQTSKQKLVIN